MDLVSSNVQRKLTAILCANVVGYSRLMGAEEKATIETLTTQPETLDQLKFVDFD